MGVVRCGFFVVRSSGARRLPPSVLCRRFGSFPIVPSDVFVSRHLGSSSKTDIHRICSVIGVDSIDQLIDETIPRKLRRESDMDLHSESKSESESLGHLASLVKPTIVAKNFIGQGYYGTLTPAVIRRNLLENPAWYTAYTPYQAEISQGRLESLFVFQTMVANIVGMEVSNCSLLDEGSAAAEAMSMFLRKTAVSWEKRPTFLVSHAVHPQTIAVVRTRAEYMGVDIVEVDFSDIAKLEEKMESSTSSVCIGSLVQFPDTFGRLVDFSFLKRELNIPVCVAVDPLALVLVEPPSWADIVVGSMQRFGVPLFLGGPHPAFLATSMGNVRRMPGRLVGQSVDAAGNPALRLALQTREQHIRLDKATSNICTSQALLANMAAMYAVYHGPRGLTGIATKVQLLAERFRQCFPTLTDRNVSFFGTVVLTDIRDAKNIVQTLSEKHSVNLRLLGENSIGVSFDESHTEVDVERLVRLLGQQMGDQMGGQSIGPLVSDGRSLDIDGKSTALPNFFGPFNRRAPLLPHTIFSSHHSETEMMRYLYRLQLKDLSLTSSMITLGSCTMKLNSAVSLSGLTWPQLADIHPFAPEAQIKGYTRMLDLLKQHLCAVTGMDACSLQPASGAAGEYAGLLTIRKYLEGSDRTVVLIPRSAHGTNSASAAMMGLEIVWVEDGGGGTDFYVDFQKKFHQHKQKLAALMITYPSTFGHQGSMLTGALRGSPRVHGRGEHERAAWADRAGAAGRRRVPPESAQDVQHSPRGRWSGHGSDLCEKISRTVFAGPRFVHRDRTSRSGLGTLHVHPHAGR